MTRVVDPIVLALRARRLHLGLTQADLVRTIGVSPRTIRGWEAGLHSPTLRDLRLWAHALGADVHLDVIDPTTPQPRGETWPS